MWLLLDSTFDENTKIVLRIVKEIEKSEIDKVYELFFFIGAYNISEMAKNIVIKNGEGFKSFMKPENLRRYQFDSDSAVLEANRLCFNYAASLRSFIDITERYALNDFGEEIKKYYHDKIQSPIYDNCIGYELFSKLRNFTVHRMFPYTSAEVNLEGVIIKCVSQRMLEWDNWNSKEREEIKNNGELLKLEKYVDESNTAIQEIWIQFISIIYGKSIETANNEYVRFKHRNELLGEAAFCEVEKQKDFGAGSVIHPLPILELQKCKKAIQKNPRVQVRTIQN